MLGSDGRIISQDIEIPRIEVQGQEKSPFEEENSKTQLIIGVLCLAICKSSPCVRNNFCVADVNLRNIQVQIGKS